MLEATGNSSQSRFLSSLVVRRELALTGIYKRVRRLGWAGHSEENKEVRILANFLVTSRNYEMIYWLHQRGSLCGGLIRA